MKKNPQTAFSISMPTSLRRIVERRVRDGGFGNVSEYIRSLVRADHERPTGSSLPGRPAPRGPGGTGTRKSTLRSLAVGFSTAQWRELREALLDGEQRLMAARIAEGAELFRVALRVRRAQLREELGPGRAADVDKALANWLREQCAARPGQGLRPKPRRLARPRRG